MPGALVSQTLLGQYRVDAHITATPQGEYYRVWDLKFNKLMGMTLFPAANGPEPEALKSLQSRSGPLRNLTHPGLLPFYKVEDAPQGVLLLEAFLDGPSLRDVLCSRPGQAMPIPEALAYARFLGITVGYLHSQGFVHGGLAPERIHIERDGSLHLSGMGASLRNGEIQFNPPNSPYTAPEQVQASRLSTASDIYSIAAILFELLTGQPPQDELTSPRNLNPEIPDFLSRVILQGLSRKPTDRLANTSEFFLTLCMAARLEATAIPDRISPAATPLSAQVLANWKYLPAAQVANPSIPLRPLEKQVTPAGKKPAAPLDVNRYLQIAVGLGIAAAIFFILYQIQPLPAETTTLPKTTVDALLPTPAATFTLPPAPTETHGGRILFTCTRGEYNQLCMIKADGSAYQQLTNTEANNYYPTFAPGGSMIVFASNRFGSFDLYLLILQSGNLSQLTNYIGNVISPDFSPEGQKIVFANRASDGPTSIWTVNRDGSNPQLLYAGPDSIVATSWSPDGSTIAFAMAVNQPNEYQIFLVNIDGSNVRQVSQGLQGIGGSLDWSPDGKNLLIFAGPVGDKDIFSLDIASGAATQLTDGGNNTASSYSPDGQFIVFNSLRNNEQADLFVMRADGSELRQLTDNPEPDWQPRWEP